MGLFVATVKNLIGFSNVLIGQLWLENFGVNRYSGKLSVSRLCVLTSQIVVMILVTQVVVQYEECRCQCKH